MKMHVCLFAFCLVILAGCSSSTEPEPPPRPLTANEIQVSSSAGNFGLELLKNINAGEQDKNIFISPLSMSMALTMTLNGAEGETRREMEDALRLSGISPDSINASMKSLKDVLTSMDRRVELSIANSIWGREGFPVEPDFIDVNKKYFDAEVASLDFSNPSSVNVINTWVNNQTKGKITKIIDGAISPDVMMYLINAVYFKAPWKNRFKAEDTRDDIFKTADGETVPCKMMSLIGSRFKTYHSDKLQVLDMSYGNGRFGMTLLLPNGFSTDELIETLPSQWNTIIAGLHEGDVNVEIPKFTIEYEKSLNEVLKELGMNLAFDANGADFSGISKGGLFISDVKHKTYVKVNEEGTEAAAVTSVGAVLAGGPEAFRADRPFVFAIRDYHSNTLLFLGKIMKPEL
jgi:serpin B